MDGLLSTSEQRLALAHYAKVGGAALVDLEEGALQPMLAGLPQLVRRLALLFEELAEVCKVSHVSWP